MGVRVYATYFDNVTVAAIQDVFSIKAGAAAGLGIHYIELNAGGVTSPAEIRLRLKRLPTTVTQGSGGSVPVVSAIDTGDTKASAHVVHANDTTQATTSGTAVVLAAWQWNVLMPFQYLPSPEDRPFFAAGEAFVLDIPAAPASTLVSGWLLWTEFP